MSETVLKKFGKYFLLDRIGEGGMAEIFRARMASLDANGRLLVIKRIQGAFSNNQEFVSMFRSEVQVTMRFAHPNIVQLYEAGEENGQQFIAMELVDGRNLRQLLSKLGHKKELLPVSACCFVIEQAAAGLHYAHTFKDRITGESLNLVHRDVSPQNILISYDGNIKVIDFGIAKAATNGEATRAGVIKGKLSYLSPEQVLGEVLDGRSDVFALGIVLWELLTGRRLFVAEGENEFQVLKMIESCNTFVKPPSTINPAVTKELDEIVLHALTRDPNKRYQSAEEMARALRKLLAVQFSDFGPSDLSTFIKKLFQDLIVEDRKQLQNVNGRAEELIKLGTPAPAPAQPAQQQTVAIQIDQTRIAPLGNKFEKSQITNADKLEVAGSPQRQMKVPAASRSSSYTNGNSQRIPITQPTPVTPSNGNGAGFLKVLFTFSALGGLGYFGYLYVNNPSSLPNIPGLVSPAADTKSLNEFPTEIAVVKKNAVVHLGMFPDGNLSKTRVSINSQVFDLEKGSMEVPVGEPLQLIVERPGFVTYTKDFTIKENELGPAREFKMDVKLEPMRYGTISISTRPALADVQIINLDQGARGLAQTPVTLRSPVDQQKLPAGNYKILIRNESLQLEKSITVPIQEGKDTVLTDLQLESKN